MPGSHALLSPSKSKQWLACPPSARLNAKIDERFGEQSSEYAREGTKAHALAELKLKIFYYIKNFSGMTYPPPPVHASTGGGGYGLFPGAGSPHYYI